MALSSSFPAVDPRPVARRALVNSTGLSIGSGYSPNAQLGNAFAFTGATRKTGGYGMVSTATIVDKANVLGAVDLWLFSRSVSPISTNGSTLSFSDSDMNYYVGTISFPAPTAMVNNRAIAVPAIGLNYQCQDSTLYGFLCTLTTHNGFNDAADIVLGLTMYLL